MSAESNTPWLQDPDVTLYHGDVLTTLREFPAESVDCVVTSPPFWGLRDYGVEGQLGLEPTPEQYVERMVEVFREVRRVLAAHGTVWLNLGDSYNSGYGGGHEGLLQTQAHHSYAESENHPRRGSIRSLGLKPKDLVGIPWRVAFALQADGWYLRSDIVWSKPNPMPESVTDRPTKAHEMVFLLAKGQWKTRVVQLADLHGEVVHLGNHVGPKNADVWAYDFGVRLATAILDGAKLQDEFGLPPLDSEVWQERGDDFAGSPIASHPVEHRAAVYASRFLASDVPAKEFLQQLDGMGIALADGNEFLVLGRATIPLPPGVNRYGQTAIAIHDSGEIGELDFSAHTLKFSRPSGCSYFFDQEAVREKYQESTFERYRYGGSFNGGAKHADDGSHWGDQFASDRKPAKLNQPLPRPQGETLDGSEGEAPRGPDGRRKTQVVAGQFSEQHRDGERWPNGGRNIRSVWEIATQPYPEAHFATFPEELARRCIAAGCPENGVVLDPFVGSGTVCFVARKLGRHSIGIDLSAEYLELAARRLQQQSLFAEVASGS